MGAENDNREYHFRIIPFRPSVGEVEEEEEVGPFKFEGLLIICGEFEHLNKLENRIKNGSAQSELN